MLGPAVGQVVAIDDGNHSVLQTHRCHGLGQVLRLLDFWRRRCL